MKFKKFIAVFALVLAVCTMFTTALAAETATANGDVAGAIEDTWKAAAEQVKSVVNKVVFPVIDLILSVCFFVKLSLSYFDFRQHGRFEWTGPAILFACLVFTMTAPTYIWKIIGL